jgi:circadian clock protein KaiB
VLRVQRSVSTADAGARSRRDGVGGRTAGKERILAKYILTLFVSGGTPRAKEAIANLRRICDEDLEGDYDLQVIDVLQKPQVAEDEKILATPTLVKRLPPPLRRVIGDLSDKQKVLLGLQVEAAQPPTPKARDE